MAYLKDEGLGNHFSLWIAGTLTMKSWKTIESFGCTYVIQRQRVFDAGCAGDRSILVFVTGEEGRETARAFTAALNTWDKARRFVVSRVMKDEKKTRKTIILSGRRRIQLFLFFVHQYRTIISKKSGGSFMKNEGNCENYIKGSQIRYGGWTFVTPIILGQWSDLSVDDDGLQFVLAVQDGLRKGNGIPAANQTFGWNTFSLAGKIIRTARNVVMKLSENCPYSRELWKKPGLRKHTFSFSNLLFGI